MGDRKENLRAFKLQEDFLLCVFLRQPLCVMKLSANHFNLRVTFLLLLKQFRQAFTVASFAEPMPCP